MRRYLLCCALLLSACSAPEVVQVAPLPHNVPADLLTACSGYTGPVPQDEGQFSDAALAEAKGRRCANDKLAAIDEILNWVGPR